jgi:hypothetical protein
MANAGLLAVRQAIKEPNRTQGLEIYFADPDGFPWIPYSLFP